MKVDFNRPYPIVMKVIKWLWITFASLLLLFLVYILMVKVNLFNLFGELPGYKSLENPEAENDLASELLSIDGKLLGKYYVYNRTQASYDDLSPELVETLLCTEDIRFFQHSGVDFRSLLRVGVYNILLGRTSAGGGSTITQQLAKNLFRTREVELEGHLQHLNIGVLNMLISKTKEWIVAIQLERSFTKQEILAMFMNTVFLGESAYGVKVAAKTFFNTTPDKLNYQQSAILVALVNKPSRYNPIENPDKALKKRNEILYNLVQYDSISKEVYDSLKALPLAVDYNPEGYNEGLAPYFREVIRPMLNEWAKENGYDLTEAGLRIYTTIDSRLQKYAEEAVAKHMTYEQKLFDEHWAGEDPWRDESGNVIPNFLQNRIKGTDHYKSLVARYGKNSDSVNIMLNTPRPMTIFSWKGEKNVKMSPMDSLKYYKKFLHTGFMSMDPKTGQIRAWVGGINHKYFKYDHVMKGKRQPGSTFKPFVYTAAIDNGYSPCYELPDVRVTFQMPGQDPPVYSPENFNLKFTGEKMTIRQGMARSVNSIVAQMIKIVTPETVVKYAKDMGIESHLNAVPSLCLGTSDVSVYEMAGAYSTFVNRGIYTKPYYLIRIEDKYGNVLQEFAPKSREVLSEETAYLMIHMLKGTTEETGGTALGLSQEVRESNEIGAKTGTTQNASDGWFMGVTKDLVSGVWVGGDERSIHFRSNSLGQGARMAMPIWDYYMQKVYADKSLGIVKGSFQKPLRPLSVEIDCSKYQTDVTADSVILDNIEELKQSDIK